MPYEAQVSSQGFYDPIVYYLEISYREYTKQNGKVASNVYSLLEAKGGKTILMFPIFFTAQFQNWLLTMVLYIIVGLEPMWWLHWLYDYTWHSMDQV